MIKDFKYDIYRYYGRYSETIKEKLNRPNGLKYIIVHRKYSMTKNKLLKIFYKYKMFRVSRKTFIQIPPQVNRQRALYWP